MAKSPIPPPPSRPAPGTPLVDRQPTDPHLLPDWAQEPASVSQSAPTMPRTSPTHPASAKQQAGGEGITQAILRTRDGVDNLQALLDTPEGPTKTDQILDLLTDISSQQDRLSERMRQIEQKVDQTLNLLGRLVRMARVGDQPTTPGGGITG